MRAAAAALLVVVCSVAGAATYWVAPGGSDDNAGSEAAPFATIAVAAKRLQPGDTLLIKPGTYQGGISLNLRGTPEQPVTIRCAGEVIIEGRAEQKTGWAPVPAHRGVYVASDAGPIAGAGLDLPDHPWAIADLTACASIPDLLKTYDGYYHDAPQQRLYVRHETGVALGPHAVWVLRDGFGLAVSGEHLRIEGLTVRRFAGQGLSVSSARDVTVSDCTVSHCGYVWSAAIQLAQTVDATIQNCLLFRVRNGIIAQEAEGTRLLHSTIHHTRAHGVYLVSGHDTVMSGNIICAGGPSGSALYVDHRAAGGLQADYNCYLDSGSNALISWMPLGLRFGTFWEYQRAIAGQDQHSFSADPRFVSTAPGSEDFRLRVESPCRGKASDGTDVGVVWRQ